MNPRLAETKSIGYKQHISMKTSCRFSGPACAGLFVLWLALPCAGAEPAAVPATQVETNFERAVRILPSRPARESPGEVPPGFSPGYGRVAQPGAPMLPPIPVASGRNLTNSIQSVPVKARALPARRIGRDDYFTGARDQMISQQLTAPGRGISNVKVLEAMSVVFRHNFIPWDNAGAAYEDRAVEIGFGRIIEQPYVIASALEQLNLQPTDRVLEVGAGSGYQTALLAQLVREVYAVESHRILAERARADILRAPGTTNVQVRLVADVSQGWPEAAPFDAIILNIVPDTALDALASQLKTGSRLIVPMAGDGTQITLQKNGGQLVRLGARPARPSR